MGYVKVYLFTRNDNHFSIIKIVNNYVGEIDLEDGRLVTGKQDKRGYSVPLLLKNLFLSGRLPVFVPPFQTYCLFEFPVLVCFSGEFRLMQVPVAAQLGT